MNKLYVCGRVILMLTLLLLLEKFCRVPGSNVDFQHVILVGLILPRDVILEFWMTYSFVFINRFLMSIYNNRYRFLMSISNNRYRFPRSIYNNRCRFPMLISVIDFQQINTLTPSNVETNNNVTCLCLLHASYTRTHPSHLMWCVVWLHEQLRRTDSIVDVNEWFER